MFHVWNAIRRTHALLHMGEAQQARLHMQREYRRFRASVLSRTRFYRVTMQSLVARCAITGDGSPRAFALAESYGRAMYRSKQPHVQALGLLLLADAAHGRGALDEAEAPLRECVARAKELHAPMLGVYAQRALGRLIGGDEGRALLHAADARLTSEGRTRPGRVGPGVDRPGRLTFAGPDACVLVR